MWGHPMMDGVQLNHQVKQLLTLGSWRKEGLLLTANGSRGLWQGTGRVQAAVCLHSAEVAKRPISQACSGAQSMDDNLPVLPQVLFPHLHPTCCSARPWEEGGQSG